MKFTISKKDASDLLHEVKWALVDDHEHNLAGHVEDIELAIRNMTPDDCKAYADLMLPSGKHRHVRLVLCRPYEARVFAFLAALLRSVE